MRCMALALLAAGLSAGPVPPAAAQQRVVVVPAGVGVVVPERGAIGSAPVRLARPNTARRRAPPPEPGFGPAMGLAVPALAAIPFIAAAAAIASGGGGGGGGVPGAGGPSNAAPARTR